MSEEKQCSNTSCGRSSCEGCEHAGKHEPVDFTAHLNPVSSVKKVIGIVSGKGGVGKSLVTSLMAASMKRRGHRTAILDADVTGPSIPKAFGLSGQKAGGNDIGIVPLTSASGIEIISANRNIRIGYLHDRPFLVFVINATRPTDSVIRYLSIKSDRDAANVTWVGKFEGVKIGFFANFKAFPMALRADFNICAVGDAFYTHMKQGR